MNKIKNNILLNFLKYTLLFLVLLLITPNCSSALAAESIDRAASNNSDPANVTSASNRGSAKLTKIQFIFNPIIRTNNTDYYYPIKRILDVRFFLNNIEWGEPNRDVIYHIDAIPTLSINDTSFLTIKPNYYIELKTSLGSIDENATASNYFSRIEGNLEAGSYYYQLQAISYIDLNDQTNELSIFKTANLTITTTTEEIDLGTIYLTNSSY